MLQRLVLAGVALLGLVSTLVLIDRPGTTAVDPEGGAQLAGGETTRIKGDPEGAARILAFRKRGEVVEPLEHGAEARAGDLLQLGYMAAGRSHGVLLSLDGRGVVTLHHPERPELSTALERQGEALLPNAYALDDAPDFERFLFVTGNGPVDVATVQQAARELARRADASQAPLSLADDLEQTTLLLRKVTP
jgi:hypothetical protein